MTTAFSDLIQHLEDCELKFLSNPEQQSAFFYLTTGAGTFPVTIRVQEDDAIQLRLQLPSRVPAGARNDICQAMAFANYGLKLGMFQLNCQNGEMMFHVFQLVEHGRISEYTMRTMIDASVWTMNLYFSAFMSIIYGNESPGDAIRRVEHVLSEETQEASDNDDATSEDND